MRRIALPTVIIKMQIIGSGFRHQNIIFFDCRWSGELTSLKERLTHFTKDCQDHVNSALALLDEKGPGIGRRMVGNVHAEFRVPFRVWDEVIRALLPIDLSAGDEDTAKRVLDALVTAFTSILELVSTAHGVPSVRPVGPIVQNLGTRPFGRLVTLPALARCWANRMLPLPALSGRTPKVPKRVVLDLIEELQTEAGLRSRSATGLVGRLPLGENIIWSTFAEDGGPDPFPRRPVKFETLAAVLGLDRVLLYGSSLPPRTPCILLVYRLSMHVAPRVPTIVEAYAGTGRLNYYFEVFRYDVDARNGHVPRTMPIASAQEKHGVPEVVHEVVFADRLVLPLEVAAF